MKHPLRKTPSHLRLAYKYGEPDGSLLGRDLALEIQAEQLTLEMDLSPNLLIRNKQSPAYLGAMALATSHHRLMSLQCPDNLVRTRLLRAWGGVAQPRLRLRLILRPRGTYLYEVDPHSLFTGGIQLDVRVVLGDESPGPPGQERPSEDLPEIETKDGP